MDDINRDCTVGHGFVYWASPLTKWTALVSVSSLWSFSGQFFTSCSHLPLHPQPLPPARPPPQYAGPKLVCSFKNDLKWPKVKQVTNSKLYYIKFNISISTILLNKAGQTRAKAE